MESRVLDDPWEEEDNDQVYRGEDKMHSDLVENDVLYYLSLFQPGVFSVCILKMY